MGAVWGVQRQHTPGARSPPLPRRARCVAVQSGVYTSAVHVVRISGACMHMTRPVMAGPMLARSQGSQCSRLCVRKKVALQPGPL